VVPSRLGSRASPPRPSAGAFGFGRGGRKIETPGADLGSSALPSSDTNLPVPAWKIQQIFLSGARGREREPWLGTLPVTRVPPAYASRVRTWVIVVVLLLVLLLVGWVLYSLRSSPPKDPCTTPHLGDGSLVCSAFVDQSVWR